MDKTESVLSEKTKNIVTLLGDASEGKTKRFVNLYKEGDINKEMTPDAYEENVRQHEELIRKSKKRYYAIVAFCLSVLLCFLSLITVYVISYLGTSEFEKPVSFGTFWFYLHNDMLFLYFVVFLVFFILLCTMKAISRHNKLSELEGYIYAYERFKLQDIIEEDLYESSIQMSYKYLDQYYKETREQASRGFFITLGISVIGALIIIIGVISMFTNATSAAYVTTASGVIIEFISSIFFHLYNKTIQSMGNYHNKLVLSQNVAIALKVSESIEGPEKNAVKIDMIKALTADINQHINSNKPVE